MWILAIATWPWASYRTLDQDEPIPSAYSYDLNHAQKKPRLPMPGLLSRQDRGLHQAIFNDFYFGLLA